MFVSRHTSADADSRSQCPCGPSASLWLRLPGTCRIHSASTSAGLRLWHVETPSLHQAGATIPPSLSFTRLVFSFHSPFSVPSTGQQVILQTNLFFYSTLFFKTVMKDSFSFLFVVTPPQDFIKSDFLTFHIIYNKFVYFCLSGKWFMYNGGLVERASSLPSLK